jgi:hypothetical protein
MDRGKESVIAAKHELAFQFVITELQGGFDLVGYLTHGKRNDVQALM